MSDCPRQRDGIISIQAFGIPTESMGVDLERPTRDDVESWSYSIGGDIWPVLLTEAQLEWIYKRAEKGIEDSKLERGEPCLHLVHLKNLVDEALTEIERRKHGD